MSISVVSLNRYPVKGLSADVLQRVTLEKGQGFPYDRHFGFARPGSGFDPANPKPLPKSKFYMLARDESLVRLASEFDEASGVLQLSSSAGSGQFDITTAKGRESAGQFLKAFLELPESETPELFEASPHRFTDVSVVSTEMMNAVSIINLDSVTAFSNAIGREVDPGRFRGNILISGLPAFSELDMLGRTIIIGGVTLKIVKRTRRCPATEVDLDTGKRDMKTPMLLREHYRHMDMGVYAEVLNAGLIAQGDEVELG